MQKAEYYLKGVVEKGSQRGRELGAATANLPLELAKGVPKGLYTCLLTWQGKKYKGLLYYGINSLSEQDCLEVHLLNFFGELYGETVEIKTTYFLREPREFDDPDDLREQIKEDIAQAKQLL